MKSGFQLALLMMIATSLFSQDLLTEGLALSDYVTITYNPNDWSMMTIEELEYATKTRTVTKNTIYIGGLYNADYSRFLLVKYKAVSTVGLSGVEDVHSGIRKFQPTASIENALNAVVLDRSNTKSVVFLQAFKAGILYIAVHDENYVSYPSAVELASQVNIREQYQGCASKLDGIDWQKVFLIGIQKALEP